MTRFHRLMHLANIYNRLGMIKARNTAINNAIIALEQELAQS